MTFNKKDVSNYLPKSKKIKREHIATYDLCSNFVHSHQLSEAQTIKDYISLLKESYLLPNAKILNSIYRKYSIKQLSINQFFNQITQRMNIQTSIVNLKRIVSLVEKTIEQCFDIYSLERKLEIFIFFSYTLRDDIAFDDNSHFKIYIPVKLNLILTPLDRLNKMKKDLKDELRKTYLHLIKTYVYLGRMEKGFKIENLLDEICMKGMETFFLEQIEQKGSLFSHLGLSTSELIWCKQNVWFLWKLVSHYMDNGGQSDNTQKLEISRKRDFWLPKYINDFLGCAIIETYVTRKNIKKIDQLLLAKSRDILLGTYLGKYEII